MIKKVTMFALASAALVGGLATSAQAGPSHSQDVYPTYSSCQKSLERLLRIGMANPAWYCQPVSGGYSFYPQPTYDDPGDGTVYIPEEAPPPEDYYTLYPA